MWAQVIERLVDASDPRLSAILLTQDTPSQPTICLRMRQSNPCVQLCIPVLK